MPIRRVTNLIFLFSLFLSSCSILQPSPKYSFESGLYTSPLFGRQVTQVYVDHASDSIRVYATLPGNRRLQIDSLHHQPITFNQQDENKSFLKPAFRRRSLDLDVLTIPFKYRFREGKFPRQFTTQLNGGLYLGHRTDVYVLTYDDSPLGVSKRRTNHIGFSIGGFTGIGSTTMNPWVTADRITIEYEGVAWSKGVAAIAGLNNFTAGLAFGWDHLLDGNSRFWIFQSRPWVGCVFGLNLN